MDHVMQLFPAFLLVLCRISSFFVVAPVFSTMNVPTAFKIGLAFFVSMLVFLTVGAGSPIAVDGAYLVSMLKEIAVGLLLGFSAYLFFTVVQTSGAFMDLQMGFGVANVVDPLTGVSSPMFGNLKYMLMILVFLSMNGHHYLLQAIMNSYRWIPLDSHFFQAVYGGQVSQFLARTFADTFMLALQISAPLVCAMFLADVGLALLARTAPQFNVFVVGIPIKILVGLAMLVLLMTGFGTLFQMLFDRMLAALQKLLDIVQAAG